MMNDPLPGADKASRSSIEFLNSTGLIGSVTDWSTARYAGGGGPVVWALSARADATVEATVAIERQSQGSEIALSLARTSSSTCAGALHINVILTAPTRGCAVDRLGQRRSFPRRR
jgi:hypothetical protein